MTQHFAYTNEMFLEGNIVFDGACLDGTMGIIVYQAESQEAALELFNNDPLVKSGIMNTELATNIFILVASHCTNGQVNAISLRTVAAHHGYS